MNPSDSLRETSFDLISRAYSEISLEETCAIVALDEAHVLDETKIRGWGYDSGTRMLKPVAAKFDQISGSVEADMNQLTKVLIALEK